MHEFPDQSAPMPASGALAGKKGLVFGVANAQSLAYGCARAFREAGAQCAITYRDATAADYVLPLARALDCTIAMPCDVTAPGAMEAVFDAVAKQWGRLDFAVHSIAYAPRTDLHGRLTDSSAKGFALAMDISAHSFVRMARMAEPLMAQGGALTAMSFYGAEKVVENYNLMGPVKAALEAAVRYLAVELGPAAIRVNALSPGAVMTRAASGLAQFDALLEKTARKAPEHRAVNIADVGAAAAFLASDAARAISGEIIHIDGGYHVVD